VWRDGMSKISGLLDPEARATIDAVLAKWASPGMCNPDDQSPCVDGQPSEAAIQGDTRSPAQRNHDALKAMGRSVLTSGQLGQHNGLPCTIIVSTTLQELESGCGRAVTATGSLLPMPTVIRMASHAHHYLTIFDKTHRPCAPSRANTPHSLRRPTNCVARQGSRLYPPRLYRGRGELPGPSRGK